MSVFLLFATLSNCLKQISMLTSSSTRNVIYNSFKGPNHSNIGDITAKGEAQISFVDLFGTSFGIFLSRRVGVSVCRLVACYALLQSMEVACMYMQIRSVVLKTYNFERLWGNVEGFVRGYVEGGKLGEIETPKDVARKERIFLKPKNCRRRADAFGSFKRANLDPDELKVSFACVCVCVFFFSFSFFFFCANFVH